MAETQKSITRVRIQINKICQEIYGGYIPESDMKLIVKFLKVYHDYLLFGDISALNKVHKDISKSQELQPDNPFLPQAIDLISSDNEKPKKISGLKYPRVTKRNYRKGEDDSWDFS